MGGENVCNICIEEPCICFDEAKLKAKRDMQRVTFVFLRGESIRLHLDWWGKCRTCAWWKGDRTTQEAGPCSNEESPLFYQTTWSEGRCTEWASFDMEVAMTVLDLDKIKTDCILCWQQENKRQPGAHKLSTPDPAFQPWICERHYNEVFNAQGRISMSSSIKKDST